MHSCGVCNVRKKSCMYSCGVCNVRKKSCMYSCGGCNVRKKSCTTGFEPTSAVSSQNESVQCVCCGSCLIPQSIH